ncbi:MAG: hypothetical protein MZV63_55515 [Marinilabiliales bacterium]|nr:hypothetical protein [Marinilabiliales bacterium]
MAIKAKVVMISIFFISGWINNKVADKRPDNRKAGKIVAVLEIWKYIKVSLRLSGNLNS